jgi:DNA modification methylase
VKGAGVGDYLASGQVHIGSVLELAGRLEPLSVQTIVTSPPYWGLRSYLPADHPDKAHELGGEATPEEFVANLVAVFAALRACLKDDGTIWLNLGDSYASGGRSSYGGFQPDTKQATHTAVKSAPRAPHPPGIPEKSLLLIPHRVALALQADGWVVRSAITWAKKSPMPGSCTDRPTSATEMVFLLSKNPTYYYDAVAVAEPSVSDHPSGNGYKRPQQISRDGRGSDDQWMPQATRNMRNFWLLGPEPFADAHFAVFPSEIPRRAIRAGTSQAGECASCGRAWVRAVERSFRPMTDRSAAKLAKDSGAKGLDASSRWGDVPRGYTDTETTGWAPQCACPPGTPTRPQIVLDPFSGSGTTGEVAHQEGRRFVGIDLDERAVGWHRDRLAKLPVGRLFA